MKKILTLFTLLFTLLALPMTAGAQRNGWKSSTYPFQKVKVVYLKTLVRQDADFRQQHPAFVRDDDAVRKTLLTLQRDLKKEGVAMYNNPVMLPDKKLRDTITLQVQVNHVGTESLAGMDTVTSDKKVNATAYASVTFLATKNGQTIYQVVDERSSTKYSSDVLLANIIRTAADELTKKGK